MRQGSRAARSPPGSAQFAQMRDACAIAPSTRSSSPPQSATVAAQADAIQRQTEQWPAEAVLGCDRSDMRMMMLHRDQRAGRAARQSPAP